MLAVVTKLSVYPFRLVLAVVIAVVTTDNIDDPLAKLKPVLITLPACKLPAMPAPPANLNAPVAVLDAAAVEFITTLPKRLVVPATLKLVKLPIVVILL